MKSFKEYQALAGVTRKLDETPLELAHYALGLVGEAGELGSVVKMLPEEWMKELGDCFWYSAGICSVLGLEMQGIVDAFAVPKVYKNRYSNVLNTLILSAACICEMAKKYAYYGKEPDVSSVKEALGTYLSCLLFLCSSGGFDPMDVCTANIRKLEQRFGGKFDAFRAINRDVEAEAKAVSEVLP